jgi:hypothetical protein
MTLTAAVLLCTLRETKTEHADVASIIMSRVCVTGCIVSGFTALLSSARARDDLHANVALPLNAVGAQMATDGLIIDATPRFTLASTCVRHRLLSRSSHTC